MCHTSGCKTMILGIPCINSQATQVMGNEQLSHFPAVPNPDMNQERQMQFQGKSEARLFAATMYEGEHGELPAGELNSNQQLVCADNLVHSGPSSSNARYV